MKIWTLQEEMYASLEENRNHLFELRDYFIEEVEKLVDNKIISFLETSILTNLNQNNEMS